MNEDNLIYCLGANTEQELLALMLEAGFKKIDDETYEVLGMEYIIGHTEEDDTPAWAAIPKDGVIIVDESDE